MEAYLEALDVGILRAASQGFPKPKDPTHLQGNKVNYEKWNAKARNTIFRDLCKDEPCVEPQGRPCTKVGHLCTP